MQELRPMGVPDVLDTTFQLYRERFTTFLTIALVAYVPYSLLAALTLPALDAAHPEPTAADAIGALGGGLGLLVFGIVLLPLCMAAMTHNISASYLGQNVSAAESYRFALRRLGPLILAQISVGLVVGFGLILLVVPGIIFMSWYFVTVPLVVLECLGASAAMSRSKELAKGNLGKIAVIAVLVFLLGIVFSFILQRLFGFLPGPHRVIFFIQNLLPVIILPIQTAPPVLLYYDLRIRKEAFDLQMLAAAMQQPAPATP